MLGFFNSPSTAGLEPSGVRKRAGGTFSPRGGTIEGTEYDAVTEEEARKLLGDSEMELLGVLTGVVNVTLIKSKADKNGRYRGAQGIFYKDGRVYLDVNAGLASENDTIGQRTIVLTAAHELTHFIRAYNEAGYNALREFITDELGRKGVSLESLVQRKMDRSSDNLDYDAAMEEVIADACENMLTNVDQMKRFAEENEQAAKSMWKWLDRFLKKIEKAFNVKGPHTESYAMRDKVEDLRKMWFEALAQAHENAEAGVKARVTEQKEKLSPREKEIVTEAVDKAIANKGNLGTKGNRIPILEATQNLVDYVLAASDGEIDITGKTIALHGSEIWHEYKRHSLLNQKKKNQEIRFLLQKGAMLMLLMRFCHQTMLSAFHLLRRIDHNVGLSYMQNGQTSVAM